MDENDIYQEIQERLKGQLVIIIGTGSSMALDYDFGMNSLESYLKKTVPLQINKNSKAVLEWKKVLLKRKSGLDFENSLNGVTSQILLNKIISETGKYVASINLKNLPKIEQGDIPLKALFKKLKETFCYVKPTIDVITPNYDLIIENALSQINLDFNDGFYGGLQKIFDWNESESQYFRFEHGKKTNDNYAKIKYHFKLHKVHGSLNYFVTNDLVVRNDTLSYFEKPFNLERFIITPGDTKHKRIVENRQFYREMDSAIEKAETYLFIGYGFNDLDIDKKICHNIKQYNKKAIIVTKDLTGDAPQILKDNPNIIAIAENKTGGSIIKYENSEINVNSTIWQIDVFANTIL